MLVTGAADGIGLAITEAFAGQGARIAVLDIATAKLEALAARLPAIAVETVDLRDVEAAMAAIGRLEAAEGGFDILVNNAGNDERHAFEAVTPAYWDERFAVNLRHMMFAAQAVLPGMRARGRGSIVNLGSTSWMQGAAGLIAYTTAKSATIGFTRSLAREVGKAGIRVNCVSPGWVMTERQRQLWASPEKIAATEARQCLAGAILPEHVAPLVLFLASDAAAMITGQNIVIDAGLV